MIKESGIAVKTPEIKKGNPSSKTRRQDFSQPTNSPIDHILFLQRTIGNQAVQRLFNSGLLQAKLKIGQPNDVYEQEADRVAEQVMRMDEGKGHGAWGMGMPENTAVIGQLSVVGGQKKDESIQMKPG